VKAAQRASLAFVLAILLAYVLIIALPDDALESQELGYSPEQIATFARLDRRALDDAYHAQVMKLFGVWLASTNVSETRQITNGLRNARNAYLLASSEIAKREQQPSK
jgi:hypothetical protein